MLVFGGISPLPCHAELNRGAESAALDGLLAIIEAETRFAERNGRYAGSIAELGFQSSPESAGQLAMSSAFNADWNNPNRKAASGYFFRVLPVSDESGKPAVNSFWAVAIPEHMDDQPLYFTVAYQIKNPNFPLAGWWALRVHKKTRVDLAGQFTTPASPSLSQVGLDHVHPDAFPGASLIKRFLLTSDASYPKVTPLRDIPAGSQPGRLRHKWIGGAVLLLGLPLLMMFLKRKSKPKVELATENSKSQNERPNNPQPQNEPK